MVMAKPTSLPKIIARMILIISLMAKSPCWQCHKLSVTLGRDRKFEHAVELMVTTRIIAKPIRFVSIGPCAECSIQLALLSNKYVKGWRRACFWVQNA
ncbi:hypothetical protein BU25DRAFT_162389 [Macroventuria anomochaeta]|uniref:Uncharacterized protein n=1 Tax=Macroventuria anomochaeta TaxID=301207 RepID=A0ACB6RQB7_9PLEO|nr:uncharacterized protein BU25DRAFT_162389 [Macroventuria anomochaeta]KAF2624150.1 hypothetical protein BU25DRAFT_162389 [Macroventuria anomochaeta]